MIKRLPVMCPLFALCWRYATLIFCLSSPSVSATSLSNNKKCHCLFQVNTHAVALSGVHLIFKCESFEFCNSVQTLFELNNTRHRGTISGSVADNTCACVILFARSASYVSACISSSYCSMEIGSTQA